MNFNDEDDDHLVLLAADVEHAAIDVPTDDVNVISASEGEPIAVPLDHDHHYQDDGSGAIYATTTASTATTAQSMTRIPTTRTARSPARQNISPYLHHSILEGNWAAVIERCKSHPEETRYECKRTRRTPLHEACGPRPRGSEVDRVPPAVIYAILDVDKMAASRLDANDNAPLHLACRCVDSWRRAPGRDAPNDNTGAAAITAGNANLAEQAAAGQTSEQWEEAVERLLSAFPDAASWVNKGGKNALMEACEHKHVPPTIIQSLLAANKDGAAHTDSSGKSALAKYGEANGTSLAVVRLLLDARPESVTFVDSEGRSPIHRPAFEGNVNLVESMLLRDESVAAIKDKKDMLPLHRACQCVVTNRNEGTASKVDVVKLLLEAYPEGAVAVDQRGSVPIHYATSRSPNIDIVKTFCDVDASCTSLPDDFGWTCLHNSCAVSDYSEEVIIHLLDVDPTLAKLLTKKGDTPLHLLCNNLNRTARAMQMLVDLYPDAILARNDYGFTPLHVECHSLRPSVEIVRILCERGPEALNMRTNGGELPFHMVCVKPDISLDVLQYFLDTTAGDDVLTKSGNTPLHEACFRRLSYEGIALLATARPKWVTMTNKSAATPLHLACKVGTIDTRVFQILLDIGGTEQQLNQGDSEGHTPLHSVCRPDCSNEVVSFLLRACPNSVNRTTELGETPLHLACWREAPIDVLATIARAGEPSLIVQANERGWSPLHITMNQYRSLFRRHKSLNREGRLERNEGLCKAFLLIDVLVGGDGGNVASSRFIDRDSSGSRFAISLSLHQALSARRKYGWSSVDVGLIKILMKDNVLERERCILNESPLPENLILSRDGKGNTPLHIEAGVSPVDEFSKQQLDRNIQQTTDSVLDMLLKADRSAAEARNADGDLPLDVMMESGRYWSSGMASVVCANPQALVMWLEKQESPTLLPAVLAQVSQQCGIVTTHQILKSIPGFADIGNICTSKR